MAPAAALCGELSETVGSAAREFRPPKVFGVPSLANVFGVGTERIAREKTLETLTLKI
jgi:hypothetical protein